MRLKQEQLDFLEGLLSGLDDLPDGAWQAVCCDLIENCGEFKGKDSHDVWLAYCKEHSK